MLTRANGRPHAAFLKTGRERAMWVAPHTSSNKRIMVS